MGGKKSERKVPLSESAHANPLFCRHIKWSISLISCSHKKSLCASSSTSFLSIVYLPVGLKGGGTFSRTGIFSKGFPLISLMILYCPGKFATTGLTFFATGLYFFFVTSSFIMPLPLLLTP